MKKLISLMMVLVLVLSCVVLVACGGGSDDEESTTGTPTSGTADETPATSDGEMGSLDDLNSYLMNVQSSMEMPGMGLVETEIDMEVVNDPPPKATHMIMASGMAEKTTSGCANERNCKTRTPKMATRATNKACPRPPKDSSRCSSSPPM